MAHMSKQPGSTECRSAAEIAPSVQKEPRVQFSGVEGLGNRLGSRMCGEKR